MYVPVGSVYGIPLCTEVATCLDIIYKMSQWIKLYHQLIPQFLQAPFHLFGQEEGLETFAGFPTYHVPSCCTGRNKLDIISEGQSKGKF